MKLTSENVLKTLRACFSQPDNRDDVIVEGVRAILHFDKTKIDAHRSDILSMLSQLPDEFKLHSGGGMTYLNMCLDKDGRQWTGELLIMDGLVCLGLAVGVVEYSIADREIWKALPGGVPYITIMEY